MLKVEVLANQELAEAVEDAGPPPSDPGERTLWWAGIAGRLARERDEARAALEEARRTAELRGELWGNWVATLRDVERRYELAAKDAQTLRERVAVLKEKVATRNEIIRDQAAELESLKRVVGEVAGRLVERGSPGAAHEGKVLTKHIRDGGSDEG